MINQVMHDPDDRYVTEVLFTLLTLQSATSKQLH